MIRQRVGYIEWSMLIAVGVVVVGWLDVVMGG